VTVRTTPTPARQLGLLALALIGVTSVSNLARAQQAPLVAPERYVGTLSSGAGLRLARNRDFGQSVVSPAFLDVLGGYVFASSGTLRSGVGLGASIAYTDDGGYTEPVIALEQLVLMPAYLLRYEVSPDVTLLAHGGVPIVVAGGPSCGLELAGALGYRMLAGFGAFAELGFDTFIGAATTFHPLVTLELGVFIDYEVLP
jgi:hypothetical protein